MSEIALALAMLTAPVGTPEQAPSEEQWPAVRVAIQKLAIGWEIMDPREMGHVMANRDDFAADLDALRKRYREFKDAPMVDDCKRLPDRRITSELIKFNRDFRAHVENRMAWEKDRSDVFHAALCDIDRCYRVWDGLRDAQCEFYYVTVRRAGLKKVRDAVGAENFAIGKMSEFVPQWAFGK